MTDQYDDKPDSPNGFTELERDIIEYGAFREKRQMAQAETSFRKIQRALRSVPSAAPTGDEPDALKVADETISKAIAWIGGFICSGPDQEERKAGMVQECRDALALIRSTPSAEPRSEDLRHIAHQICGYLLGDAEGERREKAVDEVVGLMRSHVLRTEPTEAERQVAAKLGDDPHAIARRRVLLDANTALVEEYVKGYEALMEDEDGREGYHIPTDEERYLIEDAINGLLADDDFVRTFNAWQDEVRGVRSATLSREQQDDAACKRAADILRAEISRLDYPRSMIPQESGRISKRQDAFREAVRYLDPPESLVKEDKHG